VPDRADYWQDAVSRAFVPLEVVLHEDAPAAATIVSRQVGFMRVSTVTAGPQTVTRSPRAIAKDGRETLVLTLLHRGIAERSQDGREAVVRPGQFSLSDSRRPFSKSIRQEFSLTSFHFPRSVLGVTDLERAAAFWSAALDLVPTGEWQNENWRTLSHRDGSGPALGLLRSESPAEHHPRLHLDLFVESADEQRTEVQRLLALGAKDPHWDS
jgi:hypothetical protein